MHHRITTHTYEVRLQLTWIYLLFQDRLTSSSRLNFKNTTVFFPFKSRTMKQRKVKQMQFEEKEGGPEDKSFIPDSRFRASETRDARSSDQRKKGVSPGAHS